MKSRIINIEDVPFEKWSRGGRPRFAIAWVAQRLNARKLGFNVTVVPPGQRSFPYHMHHANEEMFFVLEGRGSIRIGRARRRIREGDFISLPPGREFAHQILNDSKKPLRYLAVSTMEVPEVAEYPDSKKFGVFTGTAPGRKPGKGSLRRFARMKDGVDYWDGET